MSKMGIVAKLTAKEGKRDDLVAAFDSIFNAVEAETGTEIYALHEDLGDPNVVWFYELYTDGDAATAHGQSDAMKAAGPALGEFLAGRPELSFLGPKRAKGLDF